MKFYGNGVVWDASNDRELMKFINGSFETNDERIQGELIRLGYQHDQLPSPPLPAELVTADMPVIQLRELGRASGITFPVGTTKASMAAAINESRENK